jgi:hypothetical protein
VLLAGCAAEPLDPEPAVAAFRELHPRVYEVYEPDLGEEEVHDLLAGVFVGEALTEEYVTHHVNRARMAEEGLAVRVVGVDHGDVEVVEVGPDAVEIDATWWVRGRVYHQAHVHGRINRYRAIYRMVPTSEGWRVGRTRMRDLSRVRTEIGSDLFFDEDNGDPASSRGFMDPLEILDLLDEDKP